MQTFSFHLLVAFIALALSLAYTTHAVASRTLITHGISYTTMDDAWSPIHQHGRGRKSASRGGGGGGGRQAPAAAGRGPPPPGSPVASHINTTYLPLPTTYSTHFYEYARLHIQSTPPWTWPTLKKSKWP